MSGKLKLTVKAIPNLKEIKASANITTEYKTENENINVKVTLPVK
jgi:hypothetical protein